jgi:spore germination cell wall hydrolase CwlJ-like protein
MLVELCLALTVYHEARGEPLEGQRAVAEVVINRVEHSAFPDDVCSVVTDANQFSFVSKNGWAAIPSDQDAWADAVNISQEALRNLRLGKRTYSDQNLLWYHRKDITTVWSKGLDERMTIGDHKFFTDHQTARASLRPRAKPQKT